MAKFFADGHLRFLEGEWRDDNGDAVEIAPVVHGRWDAKGYCTNCGGRCIGYECAEWRTKYCPHCGAKMKGTVSLD